MLGCKLEQVRYGHVSLSTNSSMWREVGQTALSNNTFNCHSFTCFSACETGLLAELLQTKSTEAVTTAQLMCSDLSLDCASALPK